MVRSRRAIICGTATALVALAGCSAPASRSETAEEGAAVDVRVINNTSGDRRVRLTVSSDSSVVVEETVRVASGDATVVEAGIRKPGTYEISVESDGMSETATTTLEESDFGGPGGDFRVAVRPDDISIAVYE